MSETGSMKSVMEWLKNHRDCEIKMSYELSHVLVKVRNKRTGKWAAIADDYEDPDLCEMLNGLYRDTVWSESDMWRAMS